MAKEHTNGSKVSWTSIVPVLSGLALAACGGMAWIMSAHNSQPHIGAVRYEQFAQFSDMISTQLEDIKKDIQANRKLIIEGRK